MARNGRAFELEIYRALKQEVACGALGLRQECVGIYHHRRYYSAARKAEIETDVAIELHAPDTDEPFIIWIWECKDYRSSIPVDDVEEFHAKLQQIGSDKTKGTIITRGVLQKSALSYAAAHGIGVARMLPSDQIEHVMFAPQIGIPGDYKSRHDAIAALTEQGFVAHVAHALWYQGLYGLTGRNGPVVRTDLYSYLNRERVECMLDDVPHNE